MITFGLRRWEKGARRLPAERRLAVLSLFVGLVTFVAITGSLVMYVVATLSGAFSEEPAAAAAKGPAVSGGILTLWAALAPLAHLVGAALGFAALRRAPASRGLAVAGIGLNLALMVLSVLLTFGVGGLVALLR